MTSPPLFDLPRPGDVLDNKVEIRRPLGQGGMGAVFAGRHIRTGRPVAVKVLRAEIARNSGAIARFLQEALAGGRIRHPNVVDVLDASVVDGRPYIIMEHLEGETLADRILREGPLVANDVLDWGVQALAGISAAHASGVIHRDLKPENIFLSRTPTGATVVKVLDFGISKLTDVDVFAATQFSLTNPGTILGTPLFMSPEQARGSKDVDERTDVYSMGAVLYHALAGRPPFTADSYNALLAQVLMDDPVALTSLRPELPGDLARVVHQAMAKKREERFPSTEALASRLARQTRVLPATTVLYTDLHGFSSWAMKAPPELVEALLESWEHNHLEAAARHGGALRTVIGDAMLLTFTAVEHGVRAWLELTEVDRYPQEVREFVRFRSGLAQGEIRIVRSARFGPALNTAARLSHLGYPGLLAMPRALGSELPAELREREQPPPGIAERSTSELDTEGVLWLGPSEQAR